MQRSFYRLLRAAITGGAVLWLSGGCAWHPRKPRSYDKSFSDEDRDPTYHADPERADEEVHYVQ